MAPIAIFLKMLITNMTFKKSQYIVSLAKMNEKAGFDTIATVRTLSMIIIIMTFNQNFGNTFNKGIYYDV